MLRRDNHVRGRCTRICLTSICILSIAFVSPLRAQVRVDSSVTASLPAHTREVVDQLGALRMLDARGWKYHSGDLPHGEDPNLDDLSWELVDRINKGPTSGIWLRRWFEMPRELHGYPLDGTRIWLQVRVDGHGPLTEIFYFNGRRVAMGENLEPLVLFDHARAGERVLVAVKLLDTAQPKDFNGAGATIEYPANRPDPTRLYDEMLSLHILAPNLGTSAENANRSLDDAANAVDLAALGRSDSLAFSSSLQKAESILAPLRPALHRLAINLTGQSHIDAAWLWPWTDTVDVVHRTFATALQLMDEYPEFTFSQSSSAYSQWMDEKYPAVHDAIRKRVQEGRWEMVGGMWVEPDFNIPDGESQVRQLLLGKRYIQEHYGADVRIGWNPDSFGFDWQLPQIYKKSGVDYFLTTKMNWNETHKLPLKLFWWQAPDGSRVLTYFPNGLGAGINPVGIAGEIGAAAQLNPGSHEILHVYGVGDHGGGPTRASLDLARPWLQPTTTFPTVNFGPAQKFFSDIEPHLNTANMPVWNYDTLSAGTNRLPDAPQGKLTLPAWNDELYLEYHRGTYTTHADIKSNIRTSEEEMLDAEKYSSIAWLMGRPYPRDYLNTAWEKLLFNEFHDLAAGSGIGIIYKDAQRDFDVVHAHAQQSQTAALDSLLSQINTIDPKELTTGDNEVALVVFNSLGWPRGGDIEAPVELPRPARSLRVTDSTGRLLRSQILEHRQGSNRFRVAIGVDDIPAVGYAVLHLDGVDISEVPEKGNYTVRVSGTTLENKYLRVAIDASTGCITSLYDKISHFEAIASGGCGNQLQTFHDQPKASDAWNIDADFDKITTPISSVDSIETVHRGPERAAIRISRHWQNSKFVQQIVLDAASPEVQVVNDIDWHETHVLLKAAFPLAATGAKATFEIPYGAIQRPTTRNNTWDSAFFEVPAIRWADLGDGQHGFSLINESKYGYDAKGNVLRLSLLRSPIWPDPEADRGLHHFSYWLFPHAGDWKTASTVHHGYEANYGLRAIQVEQHVGVLPANHSFISVSPANVILTAVKKAEDSNALLLRVYESAGKQAQAVLRVPSGGSAATITNLMEHPETSDGLIVKNGEVSFPIHPWEIQTIRINYSPAQPPTP